MTGAIIGSAVIGAYSANEASKSAANAAKKQAASAQYAADKQYEVSMEQLAFQKEQQDKWEAIYGPVQENLASYYSNLSSDSFEAQGLQALQQSYQTSRAALDKQLASRGISSDSGLAQASQNQLNVQRMLGGAQVRATSEQQVAQQQQNFLSVGLGQQSANNAGIANAYSNQANMYGNQYTQAMQLQGQYNQMSAQAAAGVGQAIGQGINTYAMYNAMQYNPSGGYSGSQAYNANGTAQINLAPMVSPVR